jgi:signal peptidase II
VNSSFLGSASRRNLFLAIVALSVVADQVSKFWAVGALTYAFDAPAGGSMSAGAELGRFLTLAHPAGRRSVTVSESFWHFRYAENPGAAFSFLRDFAAALRRPLLLLVALAAMIFIVFYYRRTDEKQGVLRVALALVFAGALGNFLDRVRFGYVIDFIDWHWYESFTWPTFNVADACISVGVGLMLLDMARQPRVKASTKGA